MTFSRLLRGLKTHRKDKQQSSNNQIQGSPRHTRNSRIGLPQRVSLFYILFFIKKSIEFFIIYFFIYKNAKKETFTLKSYILLEIFYSIFL